MGAVCAVDREAQKNDKEITSWLREEKQKEDDIIKLLLLGKIISFYRR
jgi:hypothetical protein